AQGSTRIGTQIVLEREDSKPSQLWALTKQENGCYSLTPKHAPDMGFDHLGGQPNPGAKIDLWTYKATDRHLQWLIKPLAGSGIAATVAADDAPKYEPPTIRPDDILPGEIKQFRFTESKIFPGTGRDVTVFIPAQYDGKKPACVYVKT